ncbi:hypothetical protein E4T44_06236 [Aureobasidium sp. EXF-8845]|nr:hypothetical protein E4T45_09284 [Aureobasidium sp. EXF-8846]KAI4844348.1 hypothetical protein E4T44_06236 [Aureobasidium sp. EXF-8845]
MAQRMPHISTEPAVKHTTPQHVRIIGMSLAEKAYQMPNRPLCLVYLGDAAATNHQVIVLMAKVYGAMTGNPSDKEAMLDAATRTQSDRLVLHSLIDLATPVEVVRAVDCGSSSSEAGLSIKTDEGLSLDLEVLNPDLVILHRTDSDKAWLPSTKMMALHGIPLLEIQNNFHGSASGDSLPTCFVPQTVQGDHCLRLSLVSSSENEDEELLNKEVPLSRSAFHALDDDVLSRHLTYLTDRAKELHELKKNMKDMELRVQPTNKSKPLGLMSLVASFSAMTAAKGLLALLMLFLATSLPIYFLHQESPASELAIRTPVLQAALNNYGLAKVNASDILHYPVTTSIVGNSTTTAVAFPTAVYVHIAKSDQLLVSLPKAYWKSGQIGVFKNGKPLTNVNNTRVIDGVLAVTLPASDAYGQVQISVISPNLPLRNETIKVDLGNRLLQRATYENAAKGVQQDVTVVHHAAKLAQAKVISDVHSVFNMSVYCVRAFGSNILDGVKSTGNAIGSVSNQTTHGLSYMGGLTYNKTSDLGSFVKSAIPQKRHWVRARNNALKIRTRLLRKSTAPKQNVVAPKRGFAQALSAMKVKFAELQKQFPSLDDIQKSLPPKPRNEATQTASKVKLSVETVIGPKTKKIASLATDTVKIAKSRKHSKKTDKKLKPSLV